MSKNSKNMNNDWFNIPGGQNKLTRSFILINEQCPSRLRITKYCETHEKVSIQISEAR